MAFLSKFGSILKQTASKGISAQVSASRPSIYQAIRCMSSSKVFVGGISYSTDEYSLREAFDKYGQVLEARIIVDRETGRSRGFGFVTFSSSEEASSAIQALDGQDLHGRRVRVNYATDRGSGFGGGGFGGGGFGGGGGYGAPAGNYGGSPPYGGNTYGTGGSGGYGGGNTYGSGGSGGYGGGNAYGSGGSGGFGGGNAFGSGGSDYGAAGGSGGTDTFAQGDTGYGGNLDGGNQTGGDSGNTTNDQFGDNNEFGNIEGADKDDNDTGVAKNA